MEERAERVCSRWDTASNAADAMKLSAEDGMVMDVRSWIPAHESTRIASSREARTPDVTYKA